LRSATWSPDGSTLATASEDGSVIVWDVTGRERSGGGVLTDALPETSQHTLARSGGVVVGQFDGGLTVVDPRDGRLTRATERVHHFPIDSLGSSATGNLLVTTDFLGTTAVWDLRTARLLGTVAAAGASAQRRRRRPRSPDGVQAALLRDEADGPLIVDLRTREVVRQLPPWSGSTANESAVLGWTHDGRRIPRQAHCVRGFIRGAPHGCHDGANHASVPTGSNLPQDVAMDPLDRYLAVGTRTGTLLVFDAHDGHPSRAAAAGQ
jgi:WD40 repeat protein